MMCCAANPLPCGQNEEAVGTLPRSETQGLPSAATVAAFDVQGTQLEE